MFNLLTEKISNIFTSILGKNQLSEANIAETIDKIYHAMIDSDVPLSVVDSFIKAIKAEFVGKKINPKISAAEYLTKVVQDKLIYFLTAGQEDTQLNINFPGVLMVMGLQGSGKTTTAAKLAQYLIENYKKNKTHSILFASVDFYRPAAIDQLEILSKKIDAQGWRVDFYRANSTEPIAACQEIYKKFKSENFDLLILDTAGRLHVDEKMISEIQEIDKLISPKYKILVLDSMTGQESLNVAKTFKDKLDYLGVILTKADSDSKGGAAFAFRYELKKPIFFLGTGEKLDDLEKFKPERAANKILGLGDLQTLIEKAESKFKSIENEAISKNFTNGKLTLKDFAQQIDMINKLGSFSSLVKYMPGANAAKVSEADLKRGELEIKRFKAMINAMTLKERTNPEILNVSRKRRIASGSGVTVKDVDNLLVRFEQIKQFAKIFNKTGGLSNFFK